MDDIAFTITIPIRDQELQDVIEAFREKKPFNAPIPPLQIQDNAGNIIDNPITQANYVEDCIAYFILETTRTYLVEKARVEAKENEIINSANKAVDLVTWMRS